MFLSSSSLNMCKQVGKYLIISHVFDNKKISVIFDNCTLKEVKNQRKIKN